eukprot:TRINITY_DN1166_c1_g1_i1.p1 TRINITY_DN1166_c1_g1~~TRINITY_DN1166_c1_g1_i1.p1  ORF type:complete len:542 (-),score=260.93 TRINITY_DN1166_c1_g1_i1:78-1703(-)
MLKNLLILSLLVLFVYGQNLDPLDGVSVKIEVPGTSSETVSDSTSQSNIIGGERDMILIGTGIGNSANCESETFVENGSWFANNGQTCSAEAVLQYDGADGSPNLAMGLGLNLNNVGSAFEIKIQSDLESAFTIEVYSSQSRVSRVIQTIQSSNSLVTYVFPFGEFSGTADFSEIGAIQLRIEARINVDVIVTLFDLIANEASGRVFSDCNCNGFQDNGDNGVEGVTVTASPESNCPSGTESLTTLTNVNGDYEFVSLGECSYSISISQSNDPCSTNARVVDVTTSPENINFGLRLAGSITVPEDRTITCLENTDTDSLGMATCSNSLCGEGQGGGSITVEDNIIAGNCDAEFTIARTFVCVDQGESGVQQIVVTDNGEAPVITIPSDIAIGCDDSTLPTSTGRATAIDSCSAVDVTFEDVVNFTCDRDNCAQAGTITRTWTATDNCGFTSTGVQTISSPGCDSPIIDCPVYYSDNDEDDCPTNEANDDDDDDEVRFGTDDDIACACNEEDDDDDDGSSSEASFVSISVFLFLVLFGVLLF